MRRLEQARLAPVVRTRGGRLAPSLATAIVVVVLAGTLTLVTTPLVSAFPDLPASAAEGIARVQDWLQTGPLASDGSTP